MAKIMSISDGLIAREACRVAASMRPDLFLKDKTLSASYENGICKIKGRRFRIDVQESDRLGSLDFLSNTFIRPAVIGAFVLRKNRVQRGSLKIKRLHRLSMKARNG